MKRISQLLLILSLFLWTNCKKPENRACWKGSGQIVTKMIALPSFQSMELHQHLHIELVQDSSEFLEVRAGENLQNFIEWTVVDGKLEIWNRNKCLFLRYKSGDVKVVIHFKTLSKLIYWGSELLTSADTIQTNHLDVLMNDGAGDISLNVLANTINIQNPHGFANIFLKGACNYLRLDMDGNGCFDAREMHVTDSISVMYASNGRSFLSTNQLKLKAELSDVGDIWAYGIPSSIQKIRYSTGDLIFK